MKNLLSTSTQRRLKLIELLDQSIVWVSSEHCAKKLNCSIKTLNSDIQYVNMSWSNFITIEQNKIRGLRLMHLTTERIASVYRQIYHESTAFRFIEGMLFYPNESAEFWIDQLYISVASFYRLIQRLEKDLEKRGLVLHHNPFYITSNEERWVRSFYQQYFSEAYTNQWPFQFDQKKIQLLVQDYLKKFEVVLDDHEIQDASLLLATSLIRMNYGFLLAPKIQSLQADFYESEMKNYKETFLSLLKDSSYYLLSQWSKEIVRTVFHGFYDWDTPQHLERMNQRVNLFLETLAKMISFELNEPDHLRITQEILYWYSEFQYYPLSNVVLFNKKKGFASEVQRFCPIFTALVTTQLAQLDTKKQLENTWMERYFSDILTIMVREWTHLLAHLAQLRKKIKTLIVSDLGHKHAEMLRDSLLLQFNGKLIVETFEKSLLFAKAPDFRQLANYELIVTNTQLPHYHGGNLLEVSNFFTPNDRHYLANRIMVIEERRAKEHIQSLDIDQLLKGENLFPY